MSDTHLSANTDVVYDRVRESPGLGRHRWIGRCKRCGASHQLGGGLGDASGMLRGKCVHHGVAISDEGGVFMLGDQGSNPTVVPVRCGDHWCKLDRVFDSHRPNRKRTECGARCLQATGPACDCKCKGENHGRNL